MVFCLAVPTADGLADGSVEKLVGKTAALMAVPRVVLLADCLADLKVAVRVE